jgi:hypothetical protein
LRSSCQITHKAPWALGNALLAAIFRRSVQFRNRRCSAPNHVQFLDTCSTVERKRNSKNCSNFRIPTSFVILRKGFTGGWHCRRTCKKIGLTSMPRHQAAMLKILTGLALASALANIASAIYIFRLHCEGFGCMGIGVLWMAWTGALAISTLFALLLRGRIAETSRLTRRALSFALYGQAGLGLTLAVYVLSRQVG